MKTRFFALWATGLVSMTFAACETGKLPRSPYLDIAPRLNPSMGKAEVKALIPPVYILTSEEPSELSYMRPSSKVSVETLHFRFDKNGRLEWVAKAHLNIEPSPTAPQFDQETMKAIEKMQEVLLEREKKGS
jgi:hypothetical protein